MGADPQGSGSFACAGGMEGDPPTIQQWSLSSPPPYKLPLHNGAKDRKWTYVIQEGRWGQGCGVQGVITHRMS